MFKKIPEFKPIHFDPIDLQQDAYRRNLLDPQASRPEPAAVDAAPQPDQQNNLVT